MIICLLPIESVVVDCMKSPALICLYNTSRFPSLIRHKIWPKTNNRAQFHSLFRKIAHQRLKQIFSFGLQYRTFYFLYTESASSINIEKLSCLTLGKTNVVLYLKHPPFCFVFFKIQFHRSNSGERID